MAYKSRAVTVTDAATRLDTADEVAGARGVSFAFYNNGATTIYVGGADVTTTNGAPVPAGTWSPGLDLEGTSTLPAESLGGDDHEAVYGRCATGLSAEARVLEGGV